MKERRRKETLRPTVETVEGRCLLSSSTLSFHTVPSRTIPAQQPQGPNANFNLANSQGPQGNATDFFEPTGNPTPHERAREKFSATFTGTYVLGGGRYDSQSRSFTFRGAGSGSYFLHGDVQLGTVTPEDVTSPISGFLAMFDRNVNTNFAYALDLSGDQVTGVDKLGRPTHLTYTTDVNGSAGLTAESLSQGTVTIRYHSTGGRSRGIIARGTASIHVSGRVYTLGANQLLKNSNINR